MLSDLPNFMSSLSWGFLGVCVCVCVCVCVDFGCPGRERKRKRAGPESSVCPAMASRHLGSSFRG